MTTISSEKLLKILHAPLTVSHPHIKYGSLDMIKESYEANRNDSKVQEAQLALKTAISTWDDEQIADFITNYLLEIPEYKKSKELVEFRADLMMVYNYLFPE